MMIEKYTGTVDCLAEAKRKDDKDNCAEINQFS